MTREDSEAQIQLDDDHDVMGVSNDEELVQLQHTRSVQCEEDEVGEEEIPSNIQVLDSFKIVKSFAQHNTLNHAISSLRDIEKLLSLSVQNKKKN